MIVGVRGPREEEKGGGGSEGSLCSGVFSKRLRSSV